MFSDSVTDKQCDGLVVKYLFVVASLLDSQIAHKRLFTFPTNCGPLSTAGPRSTVEHPQHPVNSLTVQSIFKQRT